MNEIRNLFNEFCYQLSFDELNRNPKILKSIESFECAIQKLSEPGENNE